MALSKNTPIKEVLGDFAVQPLYRAIHAYEGSMIFHRADGYATTAAGGLAFLGHADAEANNANGSDGDLSVHVRQGTYRAQVTLASVAITDVGSAVYASDDATLTLTATANSLVGKVVKYVTTNTCIVQFTAMGASAAVGLTQQAHIADAKVNYTTGDLDAEAEIITAFNTTNGKINALLAALETAGVLASS